MIAPFRSFISLITEDHYDLSRKRKQIRTKEHIWIEDILGGWDKMYIVTV